MQPPDPAGLPGVGERLDLTFTDLSHTGEGVGRINGQVCFVPGALPQETARVRLEHLGRQHWRAELEELLVASPERRRAPCILAEVCGGCSLQHWSDRAQLRWKRQRVQEAMQRIGGMQVTVRDVLAGDAVLHYRNRAIIPLQRSEQGRLKAGYYRRGSHRIVNMNRCPVLDPRLDSLIQPLKLDLDQSGLPADSDARRGGGLRHLALRVGQRTDQVLITLVCSQANLEGVDLLARRWLERWPQVVGVTLNIQPEPNNLLMGPQNRTLCGRGWIEEQFAGLTLRIAAETFFQVNTAQAERVVPLLLEALDGHPVGSAVDAYCGIGTYSLPLAQHGWMVHGLERHAGAVELAELNAARNGLSDHARFTAMDVAEGLTAALNGAELLFLDPPRKGLEATVLKAISGNAPPCLLYLSCDPATLARDLRALHGTCGYRVESLQPLDFFPQTSHVETLAVLRR